MQRDELANWLRLQLTPGIGNASAQKLLDTFATPQAIFGQSHATLGALVGDARASALLRPPPGLPELLDTTWHWLSAAPQCRRVLPCTHSAYPQYLLNIADPPTLLYGIGPPAAWQHDHINQAGFAGVAVVGSRNPSAQGADNAFQFAQALAACGWCVVSGLALGIDGQAHAGALEGGTAAALPTIAVVGTGLDRVYPSHHRELAHRIAQQGLLLSEYALGTAPIAANFPRRNRIISGLSRGTLVVEAALRSGSLITAQQAVEQGKDVFAIPGSIHNAQSRGCHALIRQGAKLVECVQDLLEELLPPDVAATYRASATDLPTPGAPIECSVLQALGFDPAGLDALQLRTGLATPALQARLTALELADLVVRMPGGLFQRTAPN